VLLNNWTLIVVDFFVWRGKILQEYHWSFKIF